MTDGEEHSGACLALTTVGTEEDAAATARVLVEARLAACVTTTGPVTSVFRWEGRVSSEQERLLLIKTSRDRLEELESRLKEIHPYDVPEFLVFDVRGGLPDYLAWLHANTRTSPADGDSTSP